MMMKIKMNQNAMEGWKVKVKRKKIFPESLAKRGSEGVRMVMVKRGGDMGMRGGLIH